MRSKYQYHTTFASWADKPLYLGCLVFNWSYDEESAVTGLSPPVEAFDLVIFGGTGDLAYRKLLPALYQRFADEQILPGSRIIGAARDGIDDAEYRRRVAH